MKIAILINTFHSGFGMDNVAKLQAVELSEIGYDVTVFTFESSSSIDNCNIVELNWPRKLLFNYMYRFIYPFDFFKNYAYSKKLKNYDVVIAHFYPMTFLAYFTKKMHPKIKYIYHNHGVHSVEDNSHNSLFEYFTRKCISFFTTLSISNADGVISISQYISDSLQIHKPMKREIIYNKVDINQLKYVLSDINPSILRIGNENKNNPIFLYVGVLTYYKGIPLLIESFKKVLETYPDARLILVGKMAYQFNLDRFLDENLLNNVQYLGRVSNKDLGYLYDICDVYVSASTWEGFNLPVVEAQLFGNPVVAFDIGAHKEVILNNETGILVEPFNEFIFSDSMIKCYVKKEEMGLNAKKWASKFSSNQRNTILTDLILSLFN